jgi:hypothetical protein
MSIANILARGYQLPQMDSPVNALAQVYQLQNAQQRNALGQMELQAKREELAKAAELNALARGSVTPENRPGDGIGPVQEGGFDLNKYTQGLARIDPMQAMKLQAMMRKEEPQLMNVAPGGTVYDPRSRQALYNAPFKPAQEPNQPEALRTLAAIYGQGTPQYQAAVQQLAQKMTSHQPPVQVTYGSPVPVTLPDGSTGYVQPGNRGGPAAPVVGQDGKPVVKPNENKALTEAQAKAATFKSQMEAAEKELAGVPIDMTNLWRQADVAMAGGMLNVAASPAAQRAKQAQEQWSESFLRFKTGAAATADEVRGNVRTFFPQPGDKPDVIEQKKRMRQQAIQDISFAASGKPAATPAAPSAADPLGLRGK